MSEKIGSKVSISGFDLAFFMDVVVEDLYIEDKYNDTLFYAQTIQLDVDDIFFRKRKIIFDEIQINNFKANLVKHDIDSSFNYFFLLDAFSSKNKTKDTSNTIPWQLEINNVVLNNARFIYRKLFKPLELNGFDYNFIQIDSIYADIRNIEIKNDSIFAKINNVTAIEKCGLKIKSLNSDAVLTPKSLIANNLKALTNKSNLDLDIKFVFSNINNMSYFVDSVTMESTIKNSKINLLDIVYFAPVLQGMDNDFYISGNFKGSVPNFKTKNLKIKYGKSTLIEGNLSMTGLPNVDETYSNFKFTKLSTTLSDIQSLKLPSTDQPKKVKIPKELSKLGFVNITGNFSGFFNDFVAITKVNCSLGNLSTDISLKNNEIKNIFEYKGAITTEKFDLGEFFSAKNNIGKTSFNVKVQGAGFNINNVNLTINGTINSIVLKSYDYKNIELSGQLNKKEFKGLVSISDENLLFNFNGIADFNSDKPLFDFTAEIKNANLNKLNLINSDSTYILTSQINTNVRDFHLDSLQGSININFLKLTKGNTLYKLDDFKLTSNLDSTGIRFIKIRSDYLDSEIKGKLSFKNLYSSARNFAIKFLPKLDTSKLHEAFSQQIQDFYFDFSIKNANQIIELFSNHFSLADKISIHGNFNSKKEELNITSKGDYIKYDNILINTWQLNSNSLFNKYNINFIAQNVSLTDSLRIENVNFSTNSYNDTIDFNLLWNNFNNKYKNNGSINGFLALLTPTLQELKIHESKLIINDSIWLINGLNQVFIDTNIITINDLNFVLNEQNLNCNGKISNSNQDTLHIKLFHFDISNFDDLTKQYDFDLSGIINGSVELSNIYTAPNIISDVKIKNFAFDNDKLGDFIIESKWNNFARALEVNGDLIYKGNIGVNMPIALNGYIYPDSTKNNYNINVKLENFKLNIFSHYLTAFASNLKGFGTGNLKLSGPFSRPELSGAIKIYKGSIKIDYLNTSYTFSDSLYVFKDRLIMRNWILNDSIGNKADFSGIVQHRNFSEFNYNVSISSKNFLCLNTTIKENNLFYGKAFFTGFLKARGDVNNSILDVVGKAEKGTRFFLPLYGSEEISNNDFVQFVNKQKNNQAIESSSIVDLSGIQLNFDLEISPEAEAQIIFDPKIGDIMKGKGSGNLKFEINTTGDFKMYGDYVIEEGDYLFTLQNIINKRFKVQKGSTLSWNGDPYNAIMNVDAIYKIKTSLYDLRNSPNLINSDTTKRRVPVDCKILLTDKLLNPTISFDIDFPSLIDNEREQYRQVVNADVNKQIFSLLVLNRFIDPVSEAGIAKSTSSNGNSAVNNSSSELISNQLSNWLSQISNDFDVGVNYRPGDAISKDELEVALSTQLFQDRITIDGNFGTDNNNTTTSNIVGDANVDFKITEDGKYRLKVFYKSNSRDLINNTSPYTQGVGVFYRREFDKVGDLFKKQKKIK